VTRPSVHVVFEHGQDGLPYGASYIRSLLPLTHPANEGAFVVTVGAGYARADIVVVERLWRPGLDVWQAEELVEQARRDGACLVYALDDALLDLEALSLDQRLLVRYLAREADGILVSTESLKRRLARLNGRVVVVPNALDERLFAPGGQQVRRALRPDAVKVIGYMGTFTHLADLMLLLQALRQVLRGHGGRVEFELAGGTDDPSWLEALEGLPVRVLELPGGEYPRFVAWGVEHLRWDVGVAPLAGTPFNDCKSDVKFLDYAALGMAAVCSRVPAYAATVRDRETGLLVPESAAAWVEALETLLADDGGRRAIAARAQAYVFGERTLAHRAADWRRALIQIHDAARFERRGRP
jgi:glycosyltransferase involved in cell wall biosynthesis